MGFTVRNHAHVPVSKRKHGTFAMITRRTTLSLLAASTAVLSTRPAWAMEPPIFTEGGIAAGGADPVAFYGLSEDDDPVIGSPAFALDWNGATWHFATAENRDRFDADPDAYAPAYGGYCAYAVARGDLVRSIPEAWSVVDGRLYLNFSRRIRRRWLRNLQEEIANGDANWPTILG